MIEQILQGLMYPFLFLSLYFQVLLFESFFENHKKIKDEENFEIDTYPSVTVAVPCWNESKTVGKTLESLLALDYPKDRLKIWAVDDGSTDNTWEILQEYRDHPQIEIRTKENGGKHTVLNYVIANSTSEIFGCLDADSYVRPETLKNMVKAFLRDPEAMAVTPLMVVRDPENILQYMQTVEYNMGLIIKRILSSVGGIHVTPGPFSLNRASILARRVSQTLLVASIKKPHFVQFFN
jgi:cellulose synthase/poly-beta-1,6-N-acetylglucosamine synthase-like glycosyltransferase